MKKLKYFLFLFIILINFNVFADEFNMNSYTSATKGGTKSRYRATEIYNTGMSNTYVFGTKYNGRISDIETYFSYPFSANITYRLTYNMNTDDFVNNFGSSYWWDCDHEMTNINATVQSVNYVSYRKVTFTFTPTEATTCIRVWLRSKNLSSTAITSITNWQLNNITIYDPEWQNGSSSSSGSQGSSPGSSGTSSSNNNDEIINNATQNTHSIIDNQNTNTQDIINNNNTNTQDIVNNSTQNTQDIINNNNTNTQDIINNNNSNTEEIVKSNQICNYNLVNLSNYELGTIIASTGLENSSSNRVRSSDYIPIEPGKPYNFLVNSPFIYLRIFFYDKQKNFIISNNYGTSGTNSFNVSNASYVRLLFSKSDNSDFTLEEFKNANAFLGSSDYCLNTSYINSFLDKKNSDSINNSINDTNNYLKDDSDPAISNSALNDVFGRVHFTDPLSYLLTLPTQLINKIVSMSDTCSTVDLGTLYGVSLTLPCINLENYLGSDLWGVIDVILSVGLLSVILKNFYDTISNLLTLGGEKEAKEKFSMPTPMDFLAMILGGDNR